MSLHISNLFYHPIKSLASIQTDSLAISSIGPVLDRRFMLVDGNGKFITQRQCPQMALVKVHDESGVLTFSFASDATSSCSMPWPEFSFKGRTKQVKVWADELEGQIIDHEINHWLSKVLQRDVQLVFINDQTHRQVDLEFANAGDRTGFSDGFPLLLVSQASIDFLAKESGIALTAQNFRPNIVVSGCDAFEEDKWQKIRINEIEFELVKPCSRCVIPTIDLKTAQKHKAVMTTMLEHRKSGKNVYVGQNLIHRGEGEIVVGDTVELIA